MDFLTEIDELALLLYVLLALSAVGITWVHFGRQLERNATLLERLMIAMLAVLVVAALIGTIKFDMERTAPSTPRLHGMRYQAPEKKRPP